MSFATHPQAIEGTSFDRAVRGWDCASRPISDKNLPSVFTSLCRECDCGRLVQGGRQRFLRGDDPFAGPAPGGSHIPLGPSRSTVARCSPTAKSLTVRCFAMLVGAESGTKSRKLHFSQSSLRLSSSKAVPKEEHLWRKDKDMPMNPPDEFLKHAAQCQQMAKFTRDTESKATWMRMAERWRRCAERFTSQSSAADHDVPRQHRKPAPGWTGNIKRRVA
jgi:hypothetical protein